MLAPTTPTNINGHPVAAKTSDTLKDVCEFGDALIRTGDLDPVYIALVGAELPEPQLCRLLLSYLSFYDLGSAAWLSEREGDDYREAMLTAARNKTPSPLGGRYWPRGVERRHFRGQKCVEAVEWLRRTYSEPEAPIRSLLTAKTELDVIHLWPMFGDWAGFKAADLLDRCYGHPLVFDANIAVLFEEPRQSLGRLAFETSRSDAEIYGDLLAHFGTRTAPPRHERQCGPAEVESVLCKHKSMRAADIITSARILPRCGTLSPVGDLRLTCSYDICRPRWRTRRRPRRQNPVLMP
jgi:hypothetical protein